MIVMNWLYACGGTLCAHIWNTTKNKRYSVSPEGSTKTNSFKFAHTQRSVRLFSITKPYALKLVLSQHRVLIIDENDVKMHLNATKAPPSCSGSHDRSTL